MNELLVYSLKVNIAIALFYLFYRLFFVRDTFWNTRRHYLLLSILTSFAYPMLSVESWLEKPEPVQQLIVKSVALPEFVVIANPNAVATPETTVFTPGNVILCIYGLVSFALFIRMLVQLASIFRIRWQGRRQIVKGVNVIALEKEIAPFSFFGWVFLNPVLHTEEETRQILIHEQAHARQHHSLDVLLSELLTIVFWCNPAVWLLKREIRQNLEYLADNKVIRSGFDSRAYQYHLLQLTYQVPELKITNQFNVSPLKKRITMMNQKKSNKAGLLKYSLVVPLALALVLSSNAQTIVSKAKKVVEVTQQKVREVASLQNELPVTTDITAPQPEVAISAQEEPKTLPVQAPEVNADTTYKSDVDIVSSVTPIYPGGDKALYEYLSRNVRYPAKAFEQQQQGTINVVFVVNDEGKVDKAWVMKNQMKTDYVLPSVVVKGKSMKKDTLLTEASTDTKFLEAEAIRVVKSMPQWTPGQKYGKKVPVDFLLPFRFQIQK